MVLVDDSLYERTISEDNNNIALEGFEGTTEAVLSQTLEEVGAPEKITGTHSRELFSYKVSEGQRPASPTIHPRTPTHLTVEDTMKLAWEESRRLIPGQFEGISASEVLNIGLANQLKVQETKSELCIVEIAAFGVERRHGSEIDATKAKAVKVEKEQVLKLVRELADDNYQYCIRRLAKAALPSFDPSVLDEIELESEDKDNGEAATDGGSGTEKVDAAKREPPPFPLNFLLYKIYLAVPGSWMETIKFGIRNGSSWFQERLTLGLPAKPTLSLYSGLIPYTCSYGNITLRGALRLLTMVMSWTFVVAFSSTEGFPY
ncbi:hypothetical protein F0562_023950 [Nyssa sinensis]|uniref:Uncharacterized protein n=1 Tax=Nyssa sinensis TaxID=561372 RepID=A0A5J5BJL1_9ASTE|nr:hypothetical protein F0562_023950 [Nyssa sinensis]